MILLAKKHLALKVYYQVSDICSDVRLEVVDIYRKDTKAGN